MHRVVFSQVTALVEPFPAQVTEMLPSVVSLVLLQDGTLKHLLV